MPLPALRGHDDVRRTLGRAAVAGTLPQSILLHGPPGIGKERLGLWLAQLLFCQAPHRAPDDAVSPCGRCQPCRLTERLAHPDLHWFFPLPRPEGATADRLRDKLEESRAAELQLRRETPLHIPTYDRPPAHFLAAVQTLQQRASMRPAMGNRKVFVVGDAELMVPQESSPEAANAFLKLLEEPPADTFLILTTAQPGALLPTIRSRVLPVRLLPLAEDAVLSLLVEDRGMDPVRAGAVARAAQGAIGRALRLVSDGEGAGPLELQRQAGRTLLGTAATENPTGRLAAAHAQAPVSARGEFLDLLDALALWLRDLMAVAAHATEQVLNVNDLEFLQRIVTRLAPSPVAVSRALERVSRARELAGGNVNPQLILADLLHGINTDLRTGDGTR